MPIPGQQPDLAALPPDTSPVKRRLAAQYVREARDTASGGQYISVKDTGVGILKEEIPIVLASFGQGSNSIKSAEQGAGLGWPIAKSLVDLHGGAFTLKSRLRIGTEVTVTFPPSRVVAAMAPTAEQAPSIAPEGKLDPSSDETRRLNGRPLFRAGT